MADSGEYAPHPKPCACAGRGWFHEHDHLPECTYEECVGCVRRTVPCDALSDSYEAQS